MMTVCVVHIISLCMFVLFFKQKTAYEMCISDWSSDVCSSDLHNLDPELAAKIKQAFFTFEWKGSALEEEFVAEDKFVAIYHKSDWDIIRKIEKPNGFPYDCTSRRFQAPHGKGGPVTAGPARCHFSPPVGLV